MSILIKGMEMPKEGNWKTIRINPDGSCDRPNWQGDCTLIKGAQAIEVPSHGVLISQEWLIDIGLHLINIAKNEDFASGVKRLMQYVIESPTIIEGEGDKHERAD